MQSRSLDRLSSAVGAPGHEADDSCVSITSSVSDESSYGNAPPPPYHYAAAMKYPSSSASVISRSELQMAVQHLQQRMQRVQQKTGGGGAAEPRQPKPVLPPRPPFDTATMRRKTKNEGEQKNGADAAAANQTVSTAAEAALPVRANPVIKKRDSFEGHEEAVRHLVEAVQETRKKEAELQKAKSKQLTHGGDQGQGPPPPQPGE